MVDIWIVFAFVVLLCNYGVIIFELRRKARKMRRRSSAAGHGGQESAHDKVNQKIKKVIRTVGLYPLAYIFQWHAYGMLKTGVIAVTFPNIIWVVTTANLGGVYNLCLYGPMLWNQARLQERKKELSVMTMASRSPGSLSPGAISPKSSTSNLYKGSNGGVSPGTERSGGQSPTFKE